MGKKQTIDFVQFYYNQKAGGDLGGGGPGGPDPPLTLVFEAPKLSIFGPI